MTSSAGIEGTLGWDDAEKPTTTELGYDGDWERLRWWCLRKHIQLHGWNCPGYEIPAHPSRHLAGHHRVPLNEGGLSTASNVEIYCESCHARLHARRRHPRKRCPLGPEVVCRRLPTGSVECCGAPSGQ